jgi:SacI restriction endonuclease
MEPNEILDTAFRRALGANTPLIADHAVLDRVIRISSVQHALTRLILACVFAKSHNPKLDARKPYTQIGTADAFSGRTYDEKYLTAFIFAHELPCNPTTAFLTPALRNRNQMLQTDMVLEGKPPELYRISLELLDDVAQGRIAAFDVLTEMIRQLLIVRDQKRERMASLLQDLSANQDQAALSAEQIVTLIEQHLRLPYSSRLPVLIVAAAYESAGVALGESAKPLAGHNAADRQTGAVGDVEIVLESDRLVAAYEMKTRRITRDDIDVALQKLVSHRLEHYLFITTEPIEPEIHEYAASLYQTTGGIEIAILDCIGFLRHFLHFFHRQRGMFLESYQRLLLVEPESAVRQPLKEAWLAMRRAAEG